MAETANSRDPTVHNDSVKLPPNTNNNDDRHNDNEQLQQDKEESNQLVNELKDQVIKLQQQLKETQDQLHSHEQKMAAMSAEINTFKEAVAHEMARLTQQSYQGNAIGLSHNHSGMVFATPFTGHSSPHPTSTETALINGSTTDNTTNTALIGSASGAHHSFVLTTTPTQPHTPGTSHSPFAHSSHHHIAPPTSHASSMRSIPAPSKVLLNDQKKKDNRLVELRKITKQYMNVSDEEASLRLYKLQKTMIHVVSDLKKFMKERNEDISKSWKTIDMSTQRVAFEMVEREATSLGVPLNRCIGYWGARRLISKSWANALRTTKKHMSMCNQSQQTQSQQQSQTQTQRPQQQQKQEQQQQQQQQQQAPPTTIYTLGNPSNTTTYEQTSVVGNSQQSITSLPTDVVAPVTSGSSSTTQQPTSTNRPPVSLAQAATLTTSTMMKQVDTDDEDKNSVMKNGDEFNEDDEEEEDEEDEEDDDKDEEDPTPASKRAKLEHPTTG